MKSKTVSRPKNNLLFQVQVQNLKECAGAFEANKKTKCLRTKPNRKGMEQLSVGKWKHTNISTFAPPNDGGLPGSFIGKTRTQLRLT